MTQDLLIKRLEEDMSELKKEMKEWFATLSDKIDNLDTRFVTRREYEASKEAWKWTSSIWQMIIMLVIATSGWIMNIINSFTNKQ